MSVFLVWLAMVSLQLAVLGGLALLLERWLLRGAAPVARELLWSLVLLRGLLPAECTLALVAGDGILAPWSALRDALLPTGPGGGWALLAATGAVLFAVAGLAAYGRLRTRLRAARAPLAGPWGQARIAAARRLGFVVAPPVVASAAIHSPCVVGWWRPVVYVPAGTPAGSDRDCVHALLHEFAHVRRRDPLRAACGLLVHGVFWFHPVVWWANRRLQLARELACDAAAASAADGVDAYRTTLQRYARAQLAAARWLPAVGFGGTHPLVARLLALQEPPRRAVGRSLCAALLLVGSGLLLAASAPSFSMPTVAEAWQLPGCLARRYVVLSALQGGEPPASLSPTPDQTR